MHQCFANAAAGSLQPCFLCGAMTYCCNAAWLSRPYAALLGRFLPRLGPFVQSDGPLFYRFQDCLFSRSARDGEARRCGDQRVHRAFKVAAHAIKSRRFLEARLIHVKRTVDLDLEYVLTLVRPPVMLGDVAAGIGLIERDHIAERLELGGGKAREFAAARGAEAIAEHEIRPAAPGRRSDSTAWSGSRSARRRRM